MITALEITIHYNKSSKVWIANCEPSVRVYGNTASEALLKLVAYFQTVEKIQEVMAAKQPATESEHGR